MVYSGANLVEVYTIEMFLYLRFKMRLPLYQAYEGFSFHLYRDFNQYFHSPVRTYRGHVLTFLMHESSNTSHVLLFTHYLSMSQHNSFVMAVDMSSQYGKSEYTRLVLASDEVNGRITVGTLSDELIALYKAQYCNRLRIDLSMREKLLERCRDI